MNARFFIDTNVFVYSFDLSAPVKRMRAAKLIHKALESQQGVVSYQVAQEFFNLAFRRFTSPLSLSDAEQYIATVFQPLLRVHSSQTLFLDGMRLQHRYKIAWYDALIVASALQAQCGVLYSEDFQDGQQFEGLRVANPFV